MKKFKFITAALPLLMLLNACSKKDDASPEKLASAKINQIIISSTEQSPRVESITYDSQDRNAEWKYEGLRIYKEIPDPNNVRTGKFLFQFILNNEGLAVEATSQSLVSNYRRKFTYDGQKRITKITVEEQYVNTQTGAPNTSFRLSDTYDLTWNSESNVTSVRRTYTGDGNTDGVSYWIYDFEGYSADHPNTLKPVNIGIDVFGSQGYPVMIDGGHAGGLVNGPFFAGAQLPAKLTMQAFSKNKTAVGAPWITNYTYEKNAQKRISMLAYGGLSYRFNYK